MTRFSIRWLLLAVAFVAVACAAMKYAGPVWWTLLSAALLLLFMGSIVTVVASVGEQRVKATSRLLCIAFYGALICLWPTKDPAANNSRRLPTRIALDNVARFLGSDRFVYIDLRTGKVIPEFTPKSTDISMLIDPSKPIRDPSPNSPNARRRVGMYRPMDGRDLVAVGHLLFAILFGFLGSAFAGFVYRRSRAASDD